MPAVEHACGEVTVIDRATIDRLIAVARLEPMKRARLCLHEDERDAIQEMVIAFVRGSVVRPHRHPGRCESLLVIEGAIAVVVFDDEGVVLRRIELSGGGSRGCMVRLAGGVWHAVEVVSETAVVHEVTRGPFEVGSSEYAGWG